MLLASAVGRSLAFNVSELRCDRVDAGLVRSGSWRPQAIPTATPCFYARCGVCSERQNGRGGRPLSVKQSRSGASLRSSREHRCGSRRARRDAPAPRPKQACRRTKTRRVLRTTAGSRTGRADGCCNPRHERAWSDSARLTSSSSQAGDWANRRFVRGAAATSRTRSATPQREIGLSAAIVGLQRLRESGEPPRGPRVLTAIPGCHAGSERRLQSTL